MGTLNLMSLWTGGSTRYVDPDCLYTCSMWISVSDMGLQADVHLIGFAAVLHFAHISKLYGMAWHDFLPCHVLSVHPCAVCFNIKPSIHQHTKAVMCFRSSKWLAALQIEPQTKELKV